MMDQSANSPMMNENRGGNNRRSRFSDADGGNGGGGGNGRDRSREKRDSTRIYVSNIPYEYRWQDLKDLFRREVGDVEFVELFVDENNKPRGCGIVEFKQLECSKLALDKMNKYDLNGRQLVVKEDYGNERDKFGRVVRNPGQGGGGGGGNGGGGMNNRRNDNRDDDRMGGGGGRGGNIGGGGGMNMSMNMSMNFDDGPYNTYGLSASFLEGLGINGPLHNKVFVANLDYKVDKKKLKQIFKLAGRIQNLDLSTDKDGNSRGFAVVEFEHPVEAVQAISMFDRQMLFERRMTVRLDRIPDKGEAVKLPEGLRGIGIGLGPNGEPLRNVAQNLPNGGGQNNNNSNNSQGPPPTANNMGMGGGNMGGGNMGGGNMGGGNIGGGGGNLGVGVGGGNQNVGGGPGSILGPVPNNNLQGLSSNLTSNLAALSNVVGGLSSLTNSGLANPLLSSATLSNLGLGLGSNNDLPQANQGGSFNQPSGNSFNPNIGYGNIGGRQDFDMGGAANSVRNYNTRPQDDYGRGNNGGGYGMMNNGPQQQLQNQRKTDSIVIKNLPPTCTWQTLRDKLRDIGEVTFAEIRGQDTGVVRFAKERDAELAIKLMDGSRFEGRTVDVQFF